MSPIGFHALKWPFTDQKLNLARLPVATGAFFNHHHEEHDARRLPISHPELLGEITKWANSKDDKSKLWLSGMVGTGKSTIARTLAQLRAARSSFFFKKGDGKRGNASQLFTIIVLCHCGVHHSTKAAVAVGVDNMWYGAVRESRLAARGICEAALLDHYTKEISQTSLFCASSLGHPYANNYPLMRTVTYRVLARSTTANAAI
ncbi:hypothetical protein J4E91_004257 [Alternaria rosae]|nr:hypothetical protein J4E91_004257 [Alternaria rosae]